MGLSKHIFVVRQIAYKRLLGFRRCAIQCRVMSSYSQSASGRTGNIALLIDGDIFGPNSWPGALAVARSEGHLVRVCVFANPVSTKSSSWRSAAASLRIEFEPVTRHLGGNKNPNDIAIGMEAARLATESDVETVALAVQDADFLYVAARVRLHGRAVLAVMREGSNANLAAAFEAEGASVAWIPRAQDESARFPKMRAVLQETGNSMFASIEQVVHSTQPVDESQMVDVFMQYNYLHDREHPTLSAAATFCIVNRLCPLTIWPNPLLLTELSSILSRYPCRSWTHNPGNLAFVFPRGEGKDTKDNIHRYGSRLCASVVQGGGPFIVEASSGMVEFVLRRLGYLDDMHNADIDEALHVFCCMSRNRSVLRSIGLSIPECMNTATAHAMIHSAIMWPAVAGHWQIAPPELGMQKFLQSQNMLSRGYSHEETMNELRDIVKKHNLIRRRTFRGLLLEVQQQLVESVPNRRR